MLRNKRAQIGETFTWIPATIIVGIILIATVLIALAMARFGNFNKSSKEINPPSPSDLFEVKSLTGFLLTTDNSGGKVYNQLEIDGNLNSFSGPLANQIFMNLYRGDYSNVYLGVSNFQGSVTYNKYFNTPSDIGPGTAWTGPVVYTGAVPINDAINLSNGKYVILSLKN